MAGKIRSGDPQNKEAQAARHYWKVWLGKEKFLRQRKGPSPNNLLNYGYMALRAATARAICGAGLHPSFGIQHSNRFNAFCLADDLMEPFRPIIDRQARLLYLAGQKEIEPDTKRALLSLLTFTCTLNGQTGPLLVMLERLCASLVACYEGNKKKLAIPKPIFGEDFLEDMETE